MLFPKKPPREGRLEMRIEFVTDTFAPDVNGVAMTLGRLVSGLREQGHFVHVLHTANREKQSGETALPSLAMPGYKEVRMGLPGRLKLFRRWRKKRPDVIYVATESPLGYSAIKAASSLGIPVAAGFHTNFDEYLDNYKVGLLKPAAQAYLRKVHLRADRTFAPSIEVVERLRREGFGDVSLLGRGVDTNLFHPSRRDSELRRSWGGSDGAPVVLMVGRVAAEKNLPLGLEAFRAMQASVPDARCVVVGDGPVRKQLEEAHPDIHFAGVQTGADLAAHYASADILLFPSETETFGNVLLEGMASGLVTLSYDYAASARHVVHGVNGLKVGVGEREAFIEEAVRSLSARLGGDIQAVARKGMEKHGWGRVIGDFELELREMSASTIQRRYGRVEKEKKQKFKTIFISDIHLGTEDSKVREVIDFLKHSECDRLVLNGDIVDGWALKRGARWRKRHTRFVRTVFNMMEKQGVEVIYLRGNHDDIVDRFLPIAFGGLRMVKEFIHKGINGKSYLVVHGDGFDSVSTNHKWLAATGAVGYNVLLNLNRNLNKMRAWLGKPPYSLSKAVKSKVKSAVSFVDRYEEQLQRFAEKRGCDGIICGHIHTPADQQCGDVHYLNSGDWVESLSAVVEHQDGKFEVLYYEEFLKRLHGVAPKDEEGKGGGPSEREEVMVRQDVLSLETSRRPVPALNQQ